jgi:hypothetical protein
MCFLRVHSRKKAVLVNGKVEAFVNWREGTTW